MQYLFHDEWWNSRWAANNASQILKWLTLSFLLHFRFGRQKQRFANKSKWCKLPNFHFQHQSRSELHISLESANVHANGKQKQGLGRPWLSRVCSVHFQRQQFSSVPNREARHRASILSRYWSSGFSGQASVEWVKSQLADIENPYYCFWFGL